MKTTKRPLTICAIGSSQSSHVRDRVQSLAKRGHAVFLITDEPFGIDGVTEIVPSRSRFRLVRKIASLWRIPSLMRSCKADIVHVHYATGLNAWLAAACDRHPLVVSVMGGDILFEEQGYQTKQSRWLTKHLLERADLITAKSDFLIAALDKIGGFSNKAIKIVWGVNLDTFYRRDASLLREKLGLSPTDLVILSPRLLQPFYNIHLIIEAMPEILAEFPQAKLFITECMAARAYQEHLKTLVSRLSLEKNVFFGGDIPHDQMPIYYSLASIVVAVPPSDGLPQSLLEAMACEVPCMLSRLSRYEEIVSHRKSAYFVDISKSDISRGICALLANPSLRESITQEALQIVQSQANMEMEIQRLEEKYDDLVKAARNPPWQRVTDSVGIYLRIFIHYLKKALSLRA